MSDLDDKDFSIRAPYLQRIAELKQQNADMQKEFGETQHNQAVLINDYRQQAINLLSERDQLLARIKSSQVQESAAHIYPSDLKRFAETETFAQVFSVAVGCPEEESVPLYAAPVIPLAETELQAEIARLQSELSKFQTSEFNPDWSMLQASQESLREHMLIIKELTRKLAEQQALTTTADRLLKTWLNSIDGLVSTYNTKIKVEEFLRRENDSEELNKLLAEAAAQAVANINGEQEFVVKRARRIAKLLNLESAMPDDKTIYGCIGTVLGNFARVIEDRSEGGKFQEDSARLDYLIRTENFVWEVNRRYSIHQATEHFGISDSDYMSARDAIDALMLSAVPKKGGE